MRKGRSLCSVGIGDCRKQDALVHRLNPSSLLWPVLYEPLVASQSRSEDASIVRGDSAGGFWRPAAGVDARPTRYAAAC
jgi:hypothetical protein